MSKTYPSAWRPTDGDRERMPLKEALATPCATCGALPTGRFSDGSPKYSCGPHEPVR